MLYNPGICFIQKCLMIPDSKQQGVYHCRIHKFTHRCTYIADERWGPDIIHQRYSGYTCPTEFDEESGEIRCKLTGHLLQEGQPEYLSVCNVQEPILYPGEDTFLNNQNNDLNLLNLFLNFDIQSLVQMFAPMHNQVLSPNEQDLLMTLLCHREQQAPLQFKSERTYYYYRGIYHVAPTYGGCLDCDSQADRFLAGNKYRRYTQWIAAVRLVWRCLKPFQKTGVLTQKGAVQ